MNAKERGCEKTGMNWAIPFFDVRDIRAAMMDSLSVPVVVAEERRVERGSC
jgi:hypothetical protein